MEYISATEASERWGVSLRQVQRLLAGSRVPRAKKYGQSWMIPVDAEKPADPRREKKRPDQSLSSELARIIAATTAPMPAHNPDGIFSGTPSAGFTVTYNQDGYEVTPVDPGTYDVVITRPIDATYAAYSKTITGGLVIDPVTIDAAAISLTAPRKGATPVSTITPTAQYTGTVTWAPDDNPFAASTEYTATITLTPEFGYTLKGVGADFFTVAGATSETNEAGSGVITAAFPVTGATSSGGGNNGGGGGSSTTTAPTTREGLIPVENLATSGDKQSIVIENDIAKVTAPSNMLAGVSGIDGKQAEIVIEEGDKNALPDDVKAAIGDRPLIQLTLFIDGKQTDWSNPAAPVTVSIPYTPTAEELVNPESIVICGQSPVRTQRPL